MEQFQDRYDFKPGDCCITREKKLAIVKWDPSVYNKIDQTWKILPFCGKPINQPYLIGCAQTALKSLESLNQWEIYMVAKEWKTFINKTYNTFGPLDPFLIKELEEASEMQMCNNQEHHAQENWRAHFIEHVLVDLRNRENGKELSGFEPLIGKEFEFEEESL